uniref:inhibitor of growth protein 3 n=1 Tax=Myxine glutinosa TaxID=7769 RepID=UPI0035901F9C
MLYLEDYLEMIEQLPMDLRDRFTEMREMDLQVQNAMDELEQRVKEFFNNAKNSKPEWREEQMEAIRKDYSKALEDADEKVQLANQIYDLVDRHLRKLDQELAKFKMELEADNAGITEILERRSLELDNPPASMNNQHAHSHSRPDKRKMVANPVSYIMSEHPEKRFKSDVLLSTLTGAADASKENIAGYRGGAITPAMIGATYPMAAAQPLASYGLAGFGASTLSIAAAHAVQATAQMKEGRRTSSLKATCEALEREIGLPREGTTISGITVLAGGTGSGVGSTDSRVRKNKSSKSSVQHSAVLIQELPVGDTVVPESELTEQVDWTYDPNEPRYCICNQVSYGEMVGCDNQDCPIEWFHYGCVSLKEAPKGKWYCPQCTAAMKRRGNRHK